MLFLSSRAVADVGAAAADSLPSNLESSRQWDAEPGNSADEWCYKEREQL